MLFYKQFWPCFKTFGLKLGVVLYLEGSHVPSQENCRHVSSFLLQVCLFSFFLWKECSTSKGITCSKETELSRRDCVLALNIVIVLYVWFLSFFLSYYFFGKNVPSLNTRVYFTPSNTGAILYQIYFCDTCRMRFFFVEDNCARFFNRLITSVHCRWKSN